MINMVVEFIGVSRILTKSPKQHLKPDRENDFGKTTSLDWTID